MPPVSGVSFLLQLDDTVWVVTLGDNVAGHTFRLNWGGLETSDLAGNATAATVQAALVAAGWAGSGTAPADLVVTGGAGGPYTITMRGLNTGLVLVVPTGTHLTGGQTVAVTTGPASYTTLAGQKAARFDRGTSSGDGTTKDDGGWHVDAPEIITWTIEADSLLLETDAAYRVLESAQQGNSQLRVAAVFPSGTHYTGLATITDLPLAAPHNNLVTGKVTLKGTTVLSKV